MTITLYELQPSPHARKVRLLAAELGIPLNKVPVDPRIGETRTREYLAMNPNGRVSTLEEDGFVLWESPAILKYLSAKRPERGLCGGDPKTGAHRPVDLLVGRRRGSGHRHARLGDADQA
jgi:glutathione S-transferase